MKKCLLGLIGIVLAQLCMANVTLAASSDPLVEIQLRRLIDGSVPHLFSESGYFTNRQISDEFPNVFNEQVTNFQHALDSNLVSLLGTSANILVSANISIFSRAMDNLVFIADRNLENSTSLLSLRINDILSSALDNVRSIGSYLGYSNISSQTVNIYYDKLSIVTGSGYDKFSADAVSNYDKLLIIVGSSYDKLNPIISGLSSLSATQKQNLLNDISSNKKLSLEKIARNKKNLLDELSWDKKRPMDTISTSKQSLLQLLTPVSVTPVVVDCSVTPNSTKNYYIKGSVRGTTACANQANCMTPSTVTDQCANTTTLSEFYCSNGHSYVDIHPCPYGCLNGACKVTTADKAATVNQLAASAKALQKILDSLR